MRLMKFISFMCVIPIVDVTEHSNIQAFLLYRPQNNCEHLKDNGFPIHFHQWQQLRHIAQEHINVIFNYLLFIQT